jgi:long-chain acyl-CoA synthetase
MTTGASPISAEVIDFMRICFGATVIEGYGMTETACTISMTLPDDTTSGHVGGPLPCCEVKLEDIPEMGYTNGDQPYPRGEVCPAPLLALLEPADVLVKPDYVLF